MRTGQETTPVRRERSRCWGFSGREEGVTSGTVTAAAEGRFEVKPSFLFIYLFFSILCAEDN